MTADTKAVSEYQTWKDSTWTGKESIDSGKIVLTPGAAEKDLNFCWYSKTKGLAKVKLGKKNQLLAAMDIQEITNSSEMFAGGISLVLYFNDGTKLGFTIEKNLVIDGKQYKIAEDVSEKVGQLLKQYKL
ncbi:MAG TPA: hypothetical protein DCX57_02975 [Lachnospiraceae bacterium]|nr:hypothetical protein [Lachnospiraceae bacterium]